jgi:hypothetical protein
MDRESTIQVFPDVENPERRIPTFRDHVPPVSVVIDGSDLFGKSPIAISKSMKLLPYQTSNAEPRWVLVLPSCAYGLNLAQLFPDPMINGIS